MGIWDAILTQLGGQQNQQDQIQNKLKEGKLYSLSKIAERDPQKKKSVVTPKTLFGAPVADKSVRQKPSSMFDEKTYMPD